MYVHVVRLHKILEIFAGELGPLYKKACMNLRNVKKFEK